MRIAIAGATGRTGRQIVQQALARGHIVQALSRHRVPDARERLSWVMGNADDVDSLKSLIEEHDAVISAIGPRPDSPRASSAATSNLIGAGATRLVWSRVWDVAAPDRCTNCIHRH